MKNQEEEERALCIGTPRVNNEENKEVTIMKNRGERKGTVHRNKSEIHSLFKPIKET